MSASFCPNDEGEDQDEKADEEEEDENEKPGVEYFQINSKC